MSDIAEYDISAAMTADADSVLGQHLHKPNDQEDLAFGYWRPSIGLNRYSAILERVLLPRPGERKLHGNVSFMPDYLHRVLAEVPDGCGIAFMHGHPSPGWQRMSADDVVAERDRLAGQAGGKTGLPLLGLTRGTDGAWSARVWKRSAPRTYIRRDARSVRVVGKELNITHHPSTRASGPNEKQEATVSVWGPTAQEKLVRAHVGIVGLGSVGSLVAEALARMGLRNLTYIDFDHIEDRNLDRTAGASSPDVAAKLLKVQIAARNTKKSGTSVDYNLKVVPTSVLTQNGLQAALDCDVLVCCVDRPWPRHLLNSIAYSQLIPVIDGGIMARVKPNGEPLHVAWRIHTIGPEHQCMVCLGALRRSDVALDRDGKFDDLDYIRGLSEIDKAAISRRNVFPFSMSVAAHEVLQLVGLLTGMPKIGGVGPQIYDGYPGEMAANASSRCEPDCDFMALTASGADLAPNLVS